MPWLCAKDVGSTRGAAEDVVGHNAPWHEDKLVIEEDVDNKIKSLDRLAMSVEWVRLEMYSLQQQLRL